jgi:NADP-dependent 3-hydroxy acid dehydrogenase YdfG
MSGLDDEPTEQSERPVLNARSIWETMRFVLQQPRSCHINAIHFQGPCR